jgi:hypothetical protein
MSTTDGTQPREKYSPVPAEIISPVTSPPATKNGKKHSEYDGDNDYCCYIIHKRYV